MPGILCTSLTPDRILIQHKAVESWQDAGFDIVSINCKEEIDILRREFTDVDFIQASRDAREFHKKPLVYFDDVICALTKFETTMVGIINSDIVLRSPDLSEKLENYIEGRCFFCNRINVHEINETDGKVYGFGFDLFIFDPSLLKRIPASSFCLGMPWWDYWLPMAALISGFKAVCMDAGVAFHQTHPINYENHNFYRYGVHMWRILKEHLTNGRDDTVKQKLKTFVEVHFECDIRNRQDAVWVMDTFEIEASLLPAFAEMLCSFITYSADKKTFEV